jgi:hypothetical protein
VSFVAKVVIRSTIEGLMASMASRGLFLDRLSIHDVARLVVCCTAVHLTCEGKADSAVANDLQYCGTEDL